MSGRAVGTHKAGEVPQRRIGSAPSSTQARPRTVSSRRRASTGDAACEIQAPPKARSLGPRVSKRGHMVAESWSRQTSGSRRRSWMMEDRPNPDVESIVDQWRRPESAVAKRRLPTTVELQKLPSSEQARKVLAGELSPRTALPFLHAVKDRLAEQKEQQRVQREQRADKLRHTLAVGVKVASLAGELERRRSLVAAKAEQAQLEEEAAERKRRRDIKLAEQRRMERQRLRMRGIWTYDEAGVVVL